MERRKVQLKARLEPLISNSKQISATVKELHKNKAARESKIAYLLLKNRYDLADLVDFDNCCLLGEPKELLDESEEAKKELLALAVNLITAFVAKYPTPKRRKINVITV